MPPISPPPVTLRPIVESDAQIHAGFPPSAEIVRMYGGSTGPRPARSLAASREWVAWMQDQPYARMIQAGGAAVGHLRLHTLSRADRRARLAIGMFAEEHLGHGIGRRAIALALDDAFGPLGLHRVDLRVLAFNQRAIRCYRACGFRHEGTEREAAHIDGQWHDDLIMGILAPEHAAPHGPESAPRR